MGATKKEKAKHATNVARPKRATLSEEEVLKRMESFEARKEQFVASVRKGKA